MRIANRLRRLETAFPPCDGRLRRLAAPDHVPGPADRCRRCGRSHVLVIEEEIVEANASAGEHPSSPGVR